MIFSPVNIDIFHFRLNLDFATDIFLFLYDILFELIKLKKYPLLTLIALSIAISSCNHKEKPIFSDETEVLDNNLAQPIDCLVTGVPLDFIPIKLDMDTLIKPEVIKAGEPRIDSANRNIFPVLSPSISLVASSLPTFTPGTGKTKLPIITIASDNHRHSRFPQSRSALAPSFRDNASYNLQYLDVDHGLSSSYIRSMIEDSRGNLWLSTWTAGVTMYDGKSFTTFREDDGLISSYIWVIFEDSKGNLWFGSDGAGLGVYDGNYFKYYTVDDGLAENLIHDIDEDEDGNIWVATIDGLSSFDGKSFTTYRTENGISHNDVTSIFVDNKGSIWLSTNGGGINRYDGESFIHYTEDEGLSSNWCTEVFIDSEENVWIGTDGDGVCLYDGYSFFEYTTKQGLSSNYIKTIVEDDYGDIWFGTDGGGLTKYNRSSFVHYTKEEGLSHNSVESILEDSDGNLWFGTAGGGVIKYNEKSFENITSNQGLSGDIVRAIIEDREGNLVFGENDGFSIYNGKIFKHYGVDQGLFNPVIRSITQDNDGGYWLATTGSGATYYDGENFTHYTSDNGLSSNIIHCIYEDSKNNIWFGTHLGGLTMYDGETFYHYNEDGGLANNTVLSITEDRDGNLWFATNGGGADKFDGEKIIHNTSNEGIQGNYIRTIYEGADGSIWMGMDGNGLNRFLGDSVVNYSQDNGLSNEIVYSVIEDFDNNIWLSTENGLNVLSFTDSIGYQITNFGKLDGLKGVDFYPNSVCYDNEGKLWWGSGKALVMLDLNKYERITKAPELRITDISIKQTFIDFRKLKDSSDYQDIYLTDQNLHKLNGIKYDDVKSFTNIPEGLVLPYNFNHLIFHFSAIDWSAPHKLKYQYMLEGADQGWSPILEDNYAIFSNLSYGDYTFKVRAIGEAELWSETISYSFSISPPWWFTWWAYVIYIMLTLFILISIFRWRTKKLIENQKNLELTVSERTLEVTQQKEIVELKNKEITDSITYAKRIQEAILPSHQYVKSHLDNAFILYKPKDIVAGDFYWLEQKGQKTLLASADCTGHGVPGAMVSVVCNNALNRTVREFNLEQPGEILNKVREIVIETFSKSDEEVKDGMDISLISFDKNNLTLEYAGANNSFYLIRDGKVQITKADKQPIGAYAFSKDFTNHTFQLKKGDTFFIFTDGYVDQFGGPRGKKFKYRPFIDMLIEINSMSMADQKAFIDDAFEDWKGDKEQIDDVCVIGIRI